MPTVTLPTFHAAQARIYRERERFNVVRCGRRLGKDVLQNTIAADAALKGRMAGLFAPEYKQLTEPFDAIAEILAPCKKRSSRTEGVFRATTGGGIDIWSLNDNPLAGRGREYDVVCINEAAFTKNGQMLDTWRKAIRPTLLIRRGSAWVMSTPFGIDPDNFFYALCTDSSMGFKEHHAPTSANPLVLPEELENERKTNHPLVYRQEFEAEFVSWDGVAFFESAKWLDHAGKPLPYPRRCDLVFCVIDTALKTGREHDGTAVVYAAYNSHHGDKVTILDYDLVQVEGASLEAWMPSVFQRLEQLAEQCGSRNGSGGAHIEDKNSGTILLQQGKSRGWPVHSIDSGLTAMGKDERALSVSGYHHSGLCRMSDYAFDKIVTFKGKARNHLISQVTGFRIGDKQAATRADDLADAYMYVLALACGTNNGF